MFNMIMQEKICYLDLAWNTLIAGNPTIDVMAEYAQEDIRHKYEQALTSPYLIHWVSEKPWDCPDIFRAEEWWETAFRTPFVAAILARMMNGMIHKNMYYANNKYNRVPELWHANPLCLDPYRHINKKQEK